MKRRTLRWIGLGALLNVCAVGAVVQACSSDDDKSLPLPESDGGGTRDVTQDRTTTDDVVVEDTSQGDTVAPALLRARATISTTTDGSVTGVADFDELDGGGVQINISLAATASGLHGVHLHAGTTCDEAGAAAGGHFNPLDASHGYPDAAVHHAGDFGNIVINDAGIGSIIYPSTSVTVAAGQLSVVGHAIVVHSGKDDGVTQPTGDSGARIGCGVVQLR